MEKPLKLSRFLIVFVLLSLCGSELKAKNSLDNTGLTDIVSERKFFCSCTRFLSNDLLSAALGKKIYPLLCKKNKLKTDCKYDYLSNSDNQRFKHVEVTLNFKESFPICALSGDNASAGIIPHILRIQQIPSHQTWLMKYC
jgi:hypothetical protein